MSDTTDETSDMPEELPESTQHPDLDLIVEHWRSIAALAWCGWLVWGLGAVALIVTPEGVEVSYEPGSPCPCHLIGAATYNPHEQVVVVVCRPGGEAVPCILGGWPTPPDAYAAASAEDAREPCTESADMVGERRGS